MDSSQASLGDKLLDQHEPNSCLLDTQMWYIHEEYGCCRLYFE